MTAPLDVQLSVARQSLKTEIHNLEMANQNLEFFDHVAADETLKDLEMTDRDFWVNNMRRAEARIAFLEQRIAELEASDS